MPHDPRITPARSDLAAQSLRGVILAPHYAAPVARQVCVPAAPLRRAPDFALAFETELLFGETFEVYEFGPDFAWGQALRDGYVGYVPCAALAGSCAAVAGLPAAPASLPTHRVSALRSFVYPAPAMKHPPRAALSYGAVVSVLAGADKFARLAYPEGEGWLFAAHLTPIAQSAPDFVAEAEKFLHTPYLWGGKSSLGLDCSGLVQVALFGAGIKALRDSDQQEQTLGQVIAPPAAQAGFARGDMLFWPGHVGIAQGGGRLLHAHAHAMAVTSEDMAIALPRIAAAAGALRTVRRLP